MRFLAATRAIRICALALWLGGGLAMLAALPLIARYGAADQMRACELVNTLILNVGTAKLAIALVALAAQAVLFYNRSAAPSGWRRFASALLVMAALAAANAGQFSLSLTLLMSPAGAAAGAAPQAHLRLSPAGMALLVLEVILVSVALAASPKKGSNAGARHIEERKSKI